MTDPREEAFHDYYEQRYGQPYDDERDHPQDIKNDEQRHPRLRERRDADGRLIPKGDRS